MRITHCARIAAYTMLGKKRHTLRVFINMLLISCALVVWLVLTTALRSAHDAYIYGTLSSNYETVMLSLDASGQPIESRALQQAVQWDEIAQPVVAAGSGTGAGAAGGVDLCKQSARDPDAGRDSPSGHQ